MATKYIFDGNGVALSRIGGSIYQNYELSLDFNGNDPFTSKADFESDIKWLVLAVYGNSQQTTLQARYLIQATELMSGAHTAGAQWYSTHKYREMYRDTILRATPTIADFEAAVATGKKSPISGHHWGTYPSDASQTKYCRVIAYREVNGALDYSSWSHSNGHLYIMYLNRNVTKDRLPSMVFDGNLVADGSGRDKYATGVRIVKNNKNPVIEVSTDLHGSNSKDKTGADWNDGTGFEERFSKVTGLDPNLGNSPDLSKNRFRYKISFHNSSFAQNDADNVVDNSLTNFTSNVQYIMPDENYFGQAKTVSEDGTTPLIMSRISNTTYRKKPFIIEAVIIDEEEKCFLKDENGNPGEIIFGRYESYDTKTQNYRYAFQSLIWNLDTTDPNAFDANATTYDFKYTNPVQQSVLTTVNFQALKYSGNLPEYSFASDDALEMTARSFIIDIFPDKDTSSYVRFSGQSLASNMIGEGAISFSGLDIGPGISDMWSPKESKIRIYSYDDASAYLNTDVFYDHIFTHRTFNWKSGFTISNRASMYLADPGVDTSTEPFINLYRVWLRSGDDATHTTERRKFIEADYVVKKGTTPIVSGSFDRYDNNGNLEDVGDSIYLQPNIDLTDSSVNLYHSFPTYRDANHTLTWDIKKSDKNRTLSNLTSVNLDLKFVTRRAWQFDTTSGDNGIDVGFTNDNDSTWSQDSLVVYANHQAASAHWFKVYFTVLDSNDNTVANEVYTVAGVTSPTSSGGLYFVELGKVIPDTILNARIPSIYNNFGHKINVLVEALDNLGNSLGHTQTSNINISSDLGIETWDWGTPPTANTGMQVGISLNMSQSGWLAPSLRLITDNELSRAKKFNFQVFKNGSNTAIISRHVTWDLASNGLKPFATGYWYLDFSNFMSADEMNTHFPSIFDDEGYTIKFSVRPIDDGNHYISTRKETLFIGLDQFGIPEYSWNFDSTHSKNVFTNHFLSNTQYYVKYTPASDNSTANSINNNGYKARSFVIYNKALTGANRPYRTIISDVLGEVKEHTLRLDQTANTASELSMLQDPARDSDAYEEFEVKAYDDGGVELDTVSIIKYIPAKPTIEITNCLVTDYEGNGGVVQVSYKLSCSDEGSLANKFKISLTYSDPGPSPISIREEGSNASYLSEITIVDENSVVEEDLGGGFKRYSRTGTINLDVLSFQSIQNANSTSGSATGILKATPIDDYQVKYSNREYSKNLTIKMPFEFADNLSSSFSHYDASEVEISIANIYARDASITTVSPQNYRFKYYYDYGNQLLESVIVSAATIQSSGFYNRDITNSYFQRTVGGDVKVVIDALNASDELIATTETTASPITPISSVKMVPQLSYDILISKDERNIGVSEVKILKPDNNTLAFLDGQNVKIHFQDRITVQSGSTYVVEQDWTTQSTQTLVVGDGSFTSTYETSFYKNYQFAKNATSRYVAHRIIVEVELGNTWVQGNANSSYDEIYFHEYPDSDSNVQLLQHIAGSYNSDGTQNQGKIKLDLPGDFVFNDNGFDLSMIVKETVMGSLDNTLVGNTAEVSLTHADIRNYTWSSTVNDAGRTNVLNYDCIINDEAFYLSELKITATATANNNSDLILAYQNAGGSDKIDATFSKTRTFISEAVMNDLTLGSQALQPINVEMPLRSDGEFALTDRTLALTFGFDVVNEYYHNVSPKIVIGLGLLHFKNNSSDNIGHISNGVVCMKPEASKLAEFYLGDLSGISNATASAYKDDLLIDLKTSPLLQKDGTLFEFPVSISYEHSLYDYNGNSFDPERELAHLIYIYVEEHIQEAAINLQAYNTSGPIVISQDGSTSASNFQLPNTWLRTTDLLNAINLGELMSSYGHLEKDDNLGFVDTTEYATFNNYSVVEDSNITNYNIELDFVNNNIKKLPFVGSVEKVNIAMRSDQKIIDGETETYDLLVSSQQDYTTDVNPITDTVLHSVDRTNYRVENEVRFVATPQVYVEKSFGDLDTKVIRSKPLNFSQILDSSKTVERSYYEDLVPDFNPPFQLVVDETLDISIVDAELQNVQVTFIYKASEFTDAVEYFGTSHENITITRSIIQLGVELTETAVNVYNGDIFSLNSTALADGSGNLKFTFVDENIDLASIAGGFHPDSNFFWKYTIVPGLSYNPGGGAEQISNRDSLEESIQLVPVNLALSLPPVYDLEWEYNKEHSLTVTWKYSSATSRGESPDKDTIRDFWIENEAIYFDVYWRAHEESEKEWRVINYSGRSVMTKIDKIKDSKYDRDLSNTRKKVQDMSDWKKSGTLKMLKEGELTYSHVIEYDKIPTKYGITAAVIARTDHNSVYKSASQSINTHYEGENTIGIDQRGVGVGVNEGVLVDPPRNKKIKVHKTENEMKNISDKMKKRNLDFEDDLLQNISQVPISVTRRKAKIRKSDKPYDSKP